MLNIFQSNLSIHILITTIDIVIYLIDVSYKINNLYNGPFISVDDSAKSTNAKALSNHDGWAKSYVCVADYLQVG